MLYGKEDIVICSGYGIVERERDWVEGTMTATHAGTDANTGESVFILNT